jgi:hypothetical protein
MHRRREVSKRPTRLGEKYLQVQRLKKLIEQPRRVGQWAWQTPAGRGKHRLAARDAGTILFCLPARVSPEVRPQAPLKVGRRLALASVLCGVRVLALPICQSSCGSSSNYIRPRNLGRSAAEDFADDSLPDLAGPFLHGRKSPAGLASDLSQKHSQQSSSSFFERKSEHIWCSAV